MLNIIIPLNTACVDIGKSNIKLQHKIEEETTAFSLLYITNIC